MGETTSSEEGRTLEKEIVEGPRTERTGQIIRGRKERSGIGV